MRYLSLVEILELHEAIIANTGGARGIRDVGALESAVYQPRLTFDQADLYPDLVSPLARHLSKQCSVISYPLFVIREIDLENKSIHGTVLRTGLHNQFTTDN